MDQWHHSCVLSLLGLEERWGGGKKNNKFKAWVEMQLKSPISCWIPVSITLPLRIHSSCGYRAERCLCSRSGSSPCLCLPLRWENIFCYCVISSELHPLCLIIVLFVHVSVWGKDPSSKDSDVYSVTVLIDKFESRTLWLIFCTLTNLVNLKYILNFPSSF